MMIAKTSTKVLSAGGEIVMEGPAGMVGGSGLLTRGKNLN